MSRIINNTSADDLNSSLKLINPQTGFEIRDTLEMLNSSLDNEVKNRNRASVLKMLKAKINKIKKMKPGRCEI
jgi:hypothetical protein